MPTKALILGLAMMMSQAHAICVKNQYWKDIDSWKGYEQISELVCADMKEDSRLDLSRLTKDGWCRVIVNHKVIYYLNLDKDNKWTIKAKGPRFDINDWERLGIPVGIR